MSPIYIPGIVSAGLAAEFFKFLDAGTPWLSMAETRKECFMAWGNSVEYTYGRGRGERTYTSIEMSPLVYTLMSVVNYRLSEMGWGESNVCFLNRYENERDHLGWHADDHPGTDHTRPIAVVSLGQARELWTRPKPPPRAPDWHLHPTVPPPISRQLLEPGSLLVMPPGMQDSDQHRIPKGDRQMGARISLTFRAFLEPSDET